MHDPIAAEFPDLGLLNRFARGHEYLVGFPVQATCRGCGTLNHATVPAR